MAFNVNEMRAQLQFGGARNTLFQVDLTFPTAVVGGVEAARKAPFFVQASSLPETITGLIAVPYFGRKIKVAGDRQFQPWGVSVLTDEDFAIRHALERWHFLINSIQENKGAFPDEYKVDATITQYSKKMNPLRVYKFTGIFPVQTQAISVNWGENDQIERFDVTFDYDWHEVVAGSTGTVQG